MAVHLANVQEPSGNRASGAAVRSGIEGEEHKRIGNRVVVSVRHAGGDRRVDSGGIRGANGHERDRVPQVRKACLR